MTVRLRSAALILAALMPTACSNNQAAPAATAAPPAPSVPVVEVTPETVEVAHEWITTLDGHVNAQIRPQVSGYLVRRLYTEGARVAKGQVLFEIDARPFQVALAQAEARVAEAKAQLERANRDVARDTPLAKERAIPQAQLDTEVQVQLAAQASVKAAEAAVDAARLNVEFTKVRSLVDGIAAIATAQIGDLVTPQMATPLTTVSQVDPIRAYFSLSEREYLEFASLINSRAADTLWAKAGGLTLTLADGTAYDKPGRFLAADRQIDPRTGTMRITATFPNPQGLLRPGQYGRVKANTRTVSDALLVPQRAVTEGQTGTVVRVVAADGSVQARRVETGTRVGSRWIITKGLSAGDRVIVDVGQLPEGVKVQTKPWVEPQAAAAAGSGPATPADSAAAGGR